MPSVKPRIATPGERSIWVASQLGDPCAYETHLLLRLEPAPSAPALCSVVAALQERHPQLRATYELDGAEVTRRTATSAAEVHFVPEAESVTVDLAVQRALAHVGRLDLARRPVAFVGIQRPSGRVSHLLMVIHHIVCDRESLRIVADDVAELLEQPRDGSTSSAGYDDFQDHLEALRWSADYKAHREFWAGQAERGRGAPSFDMGTSSSAASFVYPREQGLRGASGERVLPLSPWLAAACAAVAHRLGIAAVNVAMPAGLRTRAFERTVGYFVNMLPLTVEIGSGSSRQLLGQADAVLGAAARHSVVHALGAVADSRTGPLPRPCLYFEHLGRLSSDDHPGGRRVTTVEPVDAHTARPLRYPVEVRVRERGSEAVVVVRVGDDSASSIAEAFVDFLQSLSAGGERATWSRPVVTRRETHASGRSPSPSAAVQDVVPASAGHLEEVVVEAWREGLADPVPQGKDLDFFLCGGDSLAALIVAQVLGDRVGVDLPLTFVLDHPTVRAQAAELALLLWAGGRTDG